MSVCQLFFPPPKRMTSDKMNQYKTIIVDDEWLILSELRSLLNQFPAIKIVGEASNINEAARLISACRPDVVFLDIHMPGGSGFDLLERIKINFKIIFVTAYDQYRNNKWSSKAEAYLMKPISREQLARVIHNLSISQ
ncbi:hypothetical protein A2V82_17315 [candidate division KSB1 bacterium RBG_16_48_16]|nr:MAG: hypothetical protein A2V82_17315 [candidate division KSB1 bacterium RBG_16_48_16]